MAREYTNKILDMLEEGMFDKNMLIRDLLSWTSEDSVKAFYYAYELDPSRYDEEEVPAY